MAPIGHGDHDAETMAPIGHGDHDADRPR